MARKKKKKKSSGNSYISQAGRDALLQYGGQSDELAQLLKQASSQYSLAQRQADGSALALGRTVDQTAPVLQKAYDDAATRTAQLQAGQAQDVAGLGNVADSIKAAIAAESTNSGTRQAEARARDLGFLTSQKVNALSGATYAKANAKNQYLSDLDKIGIQKSRLSSDIGAFTIKRADELQQQDFDNSIKSANLSLAERREQRQAERDAEGKPKKRATDKDHGILQDKVNAGARYARQLKQAGVSRSEIAQILSSGKLPKAAKDSGVPPPPTGLGDLSMKMAVHLGIDGGIHAQDVKRLHQRGYSVKQLGYKRYKPKKAAPKPVYSSSFGSTSMPSLR